MSLVADRMSAWSGASSGKVIAFCGQAQVDGSVDGPAGAPES
jgi:hypothetical protein